jgi:hypothetical protein
MASANRRTPRVQGGGDAAAGMPSGTVKHRGKVSGGEIWRGGAPILVEELVCRETCVEAAPPCLQVKSKNTHASNENNLLPLTLVLIYKYLLPPFQNIRLGL